MPEPTTFRLSPLARTRLAHVSTELDKSASEVLELSITHLLSTMQRDQPVWLTLLKPLPSSHKRPPDAA